MSKESELIKIMQKMTNNELLNLDGIIHELCWKKKLDHGL